MKKQNKKTAKKLEDTKAFLKVKRYFLDLIDRKDFQDEVKKLRIKYLIPSMGFSKKERHLFPEPPEYGPQYPRRWDKLIKEPIDQFFWEKLFKDEKELGEKFQIPASSLNIIDDYVLYNSTSLVDSDTPTLCVVQDYKKIGEYKEMNRENETSFPIMVRISPYASERDILEYIKVIYSKEIEPLQKKYANQESLVGRTRKKKNKERDNFIFEHRYLKAQEIKKILPEKWRTTAYNEITKVIQLQKKKRGEG